MAEEIVGQLTEEDFWTEFRQIKDELKERSGKNAQEFWTNENLTHEDVFNAIAPRDWFEIAYVEFLGTQLVRYWKEFDRSFVTALGKHLWEEANHYEIISRVLEKHGYQAPKSTPEVAKEWEELHWEALNRDSTCAIAVWNASETSTTTTMDVLIENSRRIGLDDLSRVYEKIKKDEAFHCKLGESILKRHMVTEEQRKNALWGARTLKEQMTKFYDSIYAVK